MIDTHSGETCIIIGNGPSLRNVPREFLAKYPTFGCNYINRFLFQPTYYVCIDRPLLETNADEIIPTIEAAELAFISDYPKMTNAMAYIRSLKNVVRLGEKTLVFEGESCMSGYTCVYVALKAAFYMGFARALLVGVDHSEGHFAADYPKAEYPRFERQRYHFQVAQRAWEWNGRKIINLSAHSALDEIFERGDIADYLT